MPDESLVSGFGQEQDVEVLVGIGKKGGIDFGEAVDGRLRQRVKGRGYAGKARVVPSGTLA